MTHSDAIPAVSTAESTNSRTGTAIVFPGMGPASFAEVGKFLMLDPYARVRLAEADEALGYSVFDRFRDAEEDYSVDFQIAFLVNSMALADRAVDTLGVSPPPSAPAPVSASGRRPPSSARSPSPTWSG
ncbi:hypothetical protein GCM10020254_75560 [Streptomyces goshikiensis]